MELESRIGQWTGENIARVSGYLSELLRNYERKYKAHAPQAVIALGDDWVYLADYCSSSGLVKHLPIKHSWIDDNWKDAKLLIESLALHWENQDEFFIVPTAGRLKMLETEKTLDQGDFFRVRARYKWGDKNWIVARRMPLPYYIDEDGAVLTVH